MALMFALNSRGTGFSEIREPESGLGAYLSAVRDAAQRCHTHEEVLQFLDQYEMEFTSGIHCSLYWGRTGAVKKADFAAMRAFVVMQRDATAVEGMRGAERLAKELFGEPLDQIVAFLENHAHVRLSFWGRREVTIDGYEGAVSLDWIADELRALAQTQFRAGNLTLLERVQGLDMIRAIRRLYTHSDALVEGANWITRLFLKLREWSPFSVPTRKFIDSDTQTPLGFMEFRDEDLNQWSACAFYRTLRTEEYRAQFGQPIGARHLFGVDDEFSMFTEERIRQLSERTH